VNPAERQVAHEEMSFQLEGRDKKAQIRHLKKTARGDEYCLYRDCSKKLHICMRKLFVDDIRNVPDESWMLARTITSAINAIASSEFDVISLDHDISHEVVAGEVSKVFACPETFEPVACYLAAKYQDRVDRPDIILHTSNPSGAARLASHLEGFCVERRPMRPARRETP
jgi:hypothetical protein